MAPRYVFRHPKKGGHLFITTEDPTYRYEVLCGHCDFPLEHQDVVCPRCHRKLEDCPICRERTHKKSPVQRAPERPQQTYCPVCRVTRLPMGWTDLDEMERSFCTHLYGCSAGGMLLANDELAVLRAQSSVCPVCSHEQLTPKSITAFRYIVRHCLFCSTLFAIDGAWSRGWTEEPLTKFSKDVSDRNHDLCPLCGRMDRIRKDENGGELVHSASVKAGVDDLLTKGIEKGAYLRVAELARSLLLSTDDDDSAFRKIFRLWFDPSGDDADPEQSLSVRELVGVLVGGTLNSEIRGPLQLRLERFETAWRRHLGISLDYRVGFREISRDP